MNYIRKHDCQQIMDGFTNHFDTLPDNIIEIILKNKYPTEVYKSKNNELENKKKLLKEVIHTIVLFTGKEYYTRPQINKLFKLDNKVKSKNKIYEKRLENLVLRQNFYKDCDLTKNLYIDSIGTIRTYKIFRYSNKKHLLLLNDCGILWYNSKWYNIELHKCICGDYCNLNLSGTIYNFHYYKNNFKNNFKYTKKHNHNLNQIIKNEKKISEYDNKLKFCVDCNKPLKLESVNQHLKSNIHIKNCKH